MMVKSCCVFPVPEISHPYWTVDRVGLAKYFFGVLEVLQQVKQVDGAGALVARPDERVGRVGAVVPGVEGTMRPRTGWLAAMAFPGGRATSDLRRNNL